MQDLVGELNALESTDAAALKPELHQLALEQVPWH
jgi:hypothetical protein